MDVFKTMFRDSVIDNYERITDRTNLFKQYSEYIDCDFEIKLPNFEITTEYKAGQNQVFIEYEGIEVFSPDRSYGTSVALSSMNKTLIPDKILKESFKHDFTFSIISETTDVTLKNIFYTSFEDGDDNLTPDFSFRHNDIVYVVEFTTQQSSNPTKLKQAYDVKTLKYSAALNNRMTSVKKLFYLVIVVGTSGIYTNTIGINHDLVNELVFRYKLSISIYKRLTELQIIMSDEASERSAREKEVKRILTSLPLKEDINCDEEDEVNCDGKVWTLKAYEKILRGEFDEPMVNRKIGLCLRSSINELKDASPPVIKYVDSKYKFVCKDQEELLNGFKRDSVTLIKESNTGDRRTHLKAPVQIPFLDIEADGYFDNSMDTLPNLHQDENQGMYKIWMDACYDAGTRLEDFDQFKIPDALTKEEWNRLRTNFRGTEKLARSKYHRVLVPIPDDHKVELACIGVAQEKNAFKLPGVQDYRLERKNPFPIDIDTSDISHFLNEYICTSEDYPDQIHNMIPNGLKTLDLIYSSVDLHKGTPDHIKITRDLFLKMYCCSKIGRYSSFVSDLAFELNLSLKQHCKPKEFILKKLARFPVWLLIKPTNSASHTFFSMLIKKENVINNPNSLGCFKGMTEYDEHYISEFVSVSMSKLTNWLTTESRMLNSLAYFMEFYKMLPCSEDVFIESDNESVRKIWRDVKLCLMIQLSDKDEVENELTRLRYTVMEGFVNYPVYPNPGKMITKINLRPRSRLTCFLIMKTLSTMETIHNGFYFHRVSDSENVAMDKSSNWKNLFNPIFSDSLTSPGDLINLFYLGYMNNKNKTSEKNIEGNLYVKILDMEKKFWALVDKKVTGLNDIGIKGMLTINDGYHTYDPDILTYLTKHLIKVGNELHSGQFLREVEDDILDRLSHLTIENSLTTLKASSNFNESLESYVRDQKYSRSKVIQNTMKITDDEILVVELLPKCLAKLEDKNCLHIDIFKKPQFGDFREIYVLGIDERVCQLIIETISRSICSMFKSETMTNPGSKTALPEKHSKLTNSKFRGNQCVVVGTSDDAEKWNQTHYVSKFYHFLIMLTPSYMHGIIQRILRLWMHKKIKISQILLDLFEKNTDLNIENETIQEMWGIHHGKNNNKVYQKHGNSYIKVRTGMMQGILHYTSSVLHTILQEFAKSFAQNFIDKSLEESGSSVCTVMQSSDDSSMLLSIRFDKDLGYLKALKLSSIIFKTKNKIGKFLGIYPSIKSTSNTPFVMEFNSQFFFDSSKYMPYIKTVFSSCLISEQESLQSRQEELNGLITDLISNGGSFSLASTIQASQAMLYYRLLGSSVNPFFSSFCDEIKKFPDPASGFFLMDCPLFCGISGFRYNIWNACLTSGLGRLYSALLHKDDNINQVILTNTGKVVDFDTYHAGSLVRKIILPFGSRKKWFNMIESSDLNPDWEEIVDKNPEILYRSARTKDELDLKFAIKLHSPGVTKSFDVTNILPRIVSSSTYLLNYEILEPISAWYTKPAEPEQSPIRMMSNESSFMISDSTTKVNFYKGVSDDDHIILSNQSMIVTTKTDIAGTLLLFTINGYLAGDEVSQSFRRNNTNHFAIQSSVLEINVTENIDTHLVKYNYANSPVTRINNLMRAIEDTINRQRHRTDNKTVKLSLHNLVESNISVRKLILALHRSKILGSVKFVFQLGSAEEFDLFFPSSFNKQGEGIEFKSKFSLLDLIFENEEVSTEKTLSDDDIRFLFPYNEEYLALREILLNRNVYHTKIKTYERRKVSTKLNVYDAEHNQMFSPDRIIGNTWFSLQNISASGKVIKTLFEQLQASIKWLSDDADVSKSQSPFKTHLQLQNWLARNDLSKRIVKIMGAPLISKSGNTNLLTAVCLDYSSGYELTITEHKTNFIPVSQDMKHILYMLSICPLTNEAKTNAIYGLLSGFHTLPYQAGKLKSRMNTLHCMQALTRNEEISHILYKMKQNKMGVAGSFEVRQSYDFENHCYKGPGVWKGIIDGVDVRLMISNNKNHNYIDGIIVRNDPDLKDFLVSLQDWCLDNNLTLGKTIIKPSESEKKFPRYYKGASYIYSINIFGLTIRNEGVPVFLSKDMPKFDLQFTHQSTDLLLSDNNLYLIMKANNIRTKVLKYPIRPKDYLSNYRESGDDLAALKEIFRSFICNRSLSEQDTVVFLNHCSRGTGLPPQIDKEKINEWLHEMFLGNMMKSDLIKRSYLSAPDPSDVADSNIDVNEEDFLSMMEMIDDIDSPIELNLDNMSDFIGEDMTTDVWQDTHELGPEFLSMMGLVEFGEEEPTILVNSFSVLRQSRLISNWFTDCIETYGTKSLKDLVNRRLYTTEMEESDFLRIYCYLSKIDKSKLSSKLEQIKKRIRTERTINDLL